MLIRVGYEVVLLFEKPTPLLVVGSIHPTVAHCIRKPECLVVEPPVSISEYLDGYGNRCSRMMAPAGRVVFKNDATVENSGQPDVQVVNARQHAMEDLPDEVLVFLLASRYCEVDSELRDIAWNQFGQLPAGWSLVQAVCDFVHRHIRFDYQLARANRTAHEVYRERVGVCRELWHQ